MHHNVGLIRSLQFGSPITSSTVLDAHSPSASCFSDAPASLCGALEMVLKVVESQLELDLGVGVGPVCTVGLLQGSQIWVHH